MNNNTFSEKHVSTIPAYFHLKYRIQLNQLREYVSLLSFRVNLSTNLFLILTDDGVESISSEYLPIFIVNTNSKIALVFETMNC